MIIEWQSSFEVGIPIVDFQHQALIKLLNELNARVHAGAKPTELWGKLGSFMSYAETHFSTEESLATEAGVSSAILEAHSARHEDFRYQLCRFAQSFREGDFHAGIRLSAFLNAWWTGHILTEDRELATLIRQSTRSTL